MAGRPIVTVVILSLIGGASYACATVADLDVTRPPPDSPGKDDDLAAADAEGGADSSSAVDGSVDAPDDVPSLPVPPTACSCALDQGCCVPAAGAGVCGPASGGNSCKTSGGIFLRCAGGDVANGRSCCFGQGSTETFYASTCTDAGQVCADSSECATGTCQTITCRSVPLGVCGPVGGPLPTCPP